MLVAFIRATVAVSALLIPLAASADDAPYYKGMQYALKRLGYYSKEIDGLNGPGTRAAISAYAKAHGLKGEFWPVAGDVISKKRDWEAEWTAGLEKALQSQLDQVLLDSVSARVKNKSVYFQEDGDSYHVGVCVEVNSKNSYGAYTGYQNLYLLGFKHGYDKYTLVGALDGDVADAFCMFGFVS